MSNAADQGRISPGSLRGKKGQKKFTFLKKGIRTEVFTRYCASDRLQDEQWEEWDFSQLDPKELMTCRDYEMAREAVLLERFYKQELKAEKPKKNKARTQSFEEVQAYIVRHFLLPEEWLETRVEAIRNAWQPTGFTSVPGNPNWFIFPASRVLVLYREWPNVPYLKIDRNDRLQRLAKLEHLDKERLVNLKHLLDPLNPAKGKNFTIRILKCLTHEELIEAFAALLETDFPGQGKSGRKKYGKSVYSRPQGRASDKARVTDDLNALAAYRLCRRAGLPQADVIKLITRPKAPDMRVYSTVQKLEKPLNRILQRIHEFWDQTMGDLEPLEPMDLS
jgi:hypothetical protein